MTMTSDPRPAPQCQIEEITPDQAKAWLGLNHVNRRLIESNTERLKGVIARGEWMEDSTDGIGLDVDGGVINGQHRLQAIAEGDVTVRALVVRNVRPEVIRVIDQGMPRNLAQILQMDGRYEYASDLAGAITYLWRIANDFEKAMPVAYKPSVQQLLDLFAGHPHITDSMPTAVDVSRLKGGAQRAWLAAYHYLMATVDPEAADDFFAKLDSGAEIPNGSAVHALREKITANANSVKPEPATVVAAWTVKAWEAHRAGYSLTPRTLKWVSKGGRAESFPKLSGLVFDGDGALTLGEDSTGEDSTGEDVV